jgi:hypothetical protein
MFDEKGVKGEMAKRVKGKAGRKIFPFFPFPLLPS